MTRSRGGGSLGTATLVAVLACGQVACAEPAEAPQSSEQAASAGSVSVENPPSPARLAPLGPTELAALDDSVRAPVENPSRDSDSASGRWAAQDWHVFSQKVRWAEANRLDTLEMGEAVVRMAATFVGWTYTPQTLELPGPEHVVVNLAALDCVTFIENVLALVRYQGRFGGDVDADPEASRARYESLLREIRYRSADLDGYTSRLHYFSEWLADNSSRGLLTIRTGQLGGVADSEAINFMSTHPSAYPALASDPVAVAAIQDVENRLNASPRLYIPESDISRMSSGIRDGDVIAATSTVGGLDVAHTGIAIRINGELHLLHAPLVGRVVEISELPLADRILQIGSQDGIMIATPLRGEN